jgi:hypothetical protein
MIFPFRQVLRLEWCGGVNTGFGPIVALNFHRRRRLAADIDGPKERDVAGHDIANAAAITPHTTKTSAASIA